MYRSQTGPRKSVHLSLESWVGQRQRTDPLLRKRRSQSLGDRVPSPKPTRPSQYETNMFEVVRLEGHCRTYPRKDFLRNSYKDTCYSSPVRGDDWVCCLLGWLTLLWRITKLLLRCVHVSICGPRIVSFGPSRVHYCRFFNNYVVCELKSSEKPVNFPRNFTSFLCQIPVFLDSTLGSRRWTIEVLKLIR